MADSLVSDMLKEHRHPIPSSLHQSFPLAKHMRQGGRSLTSLSAHPHQCLTLVR